MFSSIGFLAVVWFGGAFFVFPFGFLGPGASSAGLIVASFSEFYSSDFHSQGDHWSSRGRVAAARLWSPEVIRHSKIIK